MIRQNLPSYPRNSSTEMSVKQSNPERQKCKGRKRGTELVGKATNQRKKAVPGQLRQTNLKLNIFCKRKLSSNWSVPPETISRLNSILRCSATDKLISILLNLTAHCLVIHHSLPDTETVKYYHISMKIFLPTNNN